MSRTWPGKIDLERLTSDQRREFDRRCILVDELDAARDAARDAGRLIRDADREFFAGLRQRGERVSRSTLYLWRRAYLVDGVLGLLDGRWHQAPPPGRRFLDEVRRLYLKPGAFLSIALCHDIATEIARRKGWRAGTLRQTQQYIRTHILPELTAEPGVVGGR